MGRSIGGMMWEKLFDHMMRTIVRSGTMRVTYPSGARILYGDGSGTEVAIAITDTATLRKILINPDLGAGEAYMDERLTIEGDDLRGFMSIIVTNLSANNRIAWHKALQKFRNALRRINQYNPIGKAQANVAHHYDLSAELYELFLDEDKQYSCAYFRSPDDTLEQAQAQKKAHIATKLCLKPGMRVLDIGCGWGGMGLTLARDYGAQVLGVTLSAEQHKIANQRAAEAGLADRVAFKLMDYRKVTGQFDRIVSVGMFEHVGAPHHAEYFRHVHDKLTPDGIALIHTIGRPTPPGATSPWITKYIFPGGHIPAMSETLKAIENQSLWVTDVEILRLHYAETLRHWFDRFSANRDQIARLYDDRFCRMWAYYLLACEATFRHGPQGVFQFQIAKRAEAVPLTRDYLYPSPTGEKLRHAAE